MRTSLWKLLLYTHAHIIASKIRVFFHSKNKNWWMIFCWSFTPYCLWEVNIFAASSPALYLNSSFTFNTANIGNYSHPEKREKDRGHRHFVSTSTMKLWVFAHYLYWIVGKSIAWHRCALCSSYAYKTKTNQSSHWNMSDFHLKNMEITIKQLLWFYQSTETISRYHGMVCLNLVGIIH